MPHAALYNNRSCAINETPDRRAPYVARHPRRTPLPNLTQKVGRIFDAALEILLPDSDGDMTR
jgi:hypothetical protein